MPPPEASGLSRPPSCSPAGRNPTAGPPWTPHAPHAPSYQYSPGMARTRNVSWRPPCGLLPHRAQALLRALELVERLLELAEALVLLLHDLRLRLAQEVLVPELLLHALEIREQLLRLARETRALLVQVHEPIERKEDLGALHHGRRRHRRARAVTRELEVLDTRERLHLRGETVQEVELRLAAPHHDRHGLPGRYLRFHAEIAHRDHDTLQEPHLALGLGVEPRLLRLGPRRERQRLAVVRDRLPQLLGHERHERVQQSQDPVQHAPAHPARRAQVVALL